MRPRHFLLLALAATIAVIATTGCGGGSKTQSVGTPWRGSIAGVDTIPEDGEDFVPVDAWIKVYWPSQYYEPPSSFTFRLYKRTYTDWEVVKTIKQNADPDMGTWWFEPEHGLSYDTEYKIVVRDNYGDSYTAYFITEWDLGRDAACKRKDPAAYRPEGGGKSGGTAKEEHVIDTAPTANTSPSTARN